jgi:hypothetical protein
VEAAAAWRGLLERTASQSWYYCVEGSHRSGLKVNASAIICMYSCNDGTSGGECVFQW